MWEIRHFFPTISSSLQLCPSTDNFMGQTQRLNPCSENASYNRNKNKHESWKRKQLLAHMWLSYYFGHSKATSSATELFRDAIEHDLSGEVDQSLDS